jgi:hypothetical protein
MITDFGLTDLEVIQLDDDDMISVRELSKN